jgi:hypothetical protein
MEKSNKRSAVDFYKEMRSENVVIDTVRVVESWEGPGSSSYTMPVAPPMPVTPGMASRFGSFLGGHMPSMSRPSVGMVKGFLKNQAIGTAHNLAGMAVHMLIMSAVDFIVNKILASMHPAEDRHIDGALNDFANTLPAEEKKAVLKEKGKIRSEVKSKIGKHKRESAVVFYQEAKRKTLSATMEQNQKDAEKLIKSRPKQKTQAEVLAEQIAATKAYTQKTAQEKAAREKATAEAEAEFELKEKARADAFEAEAKASAAKNAERAKVAKAARDAKAASAAEAEARAKAAEEAAKVNVDHPLIEKVPSTAREDMMSAYAKAKSSVSSGIQKMKSGSIQAFKNPTDMQKGLAIGAAVAISVPMLIWAASKVKAWWDKRGGSTVKMNDQELYDHIEKNFEDYAPSSVQIKSGFDSKFKRFYINDVIKQIRSAEKVHGSNLIPILNKRGVLRGTGHTGVYEIHSEDPRSGSQKAGDWAKEHIGGALKDTGKWIFGAGKKIASEVGGSARDNIIKAGKLAMADCMAWVIDKSFHTLSKGRVPDGYFKKVFEDAKRDTSKSSSSYTGSSTPSLDALQGKRQPTVDSIKIKEEAEKNFHDYIDRMKQEDPLAAEGLKAIWNAADHIYKDRILSGIASKIIEAQMKPGLITDPAHWLAAR